MEGTHGVWLGREVVAAPGCCLLVLMSDVGMLNGKIAVDRS